MQESRSTLRVTSLAIPARSDGNGPQQVPFGGEPLGGDRGDLGVHRGVDLGHHTRPAVFAAARSSTVSSAGIIRSDFA